MRTLVFVRRRAVFSRRFIAFGAGLLVLFWQAGAVAHKTNLSRARVVVAHDRVDYQLTLSAHDVAVALGIETDLVAPVPRSAFEAKRQQLAAYLDGRLRLVADGQACRARPPDLDFKDLPGDLVIGLAFVCPAPVARLRIGYLLFFDLDAGHRGIGRIDAGPVSQEFLFDAEITELEFSVRAPDGRAGFGVALRILGFGVEHILSGIDHLLFLITLLVVSSRFLELVKIVTAFTISHSLTLGLAWFGVLSLPGRLVESLIALSVAYVAAENIWRRRFAGRWLLAFGFGLVHGLGFYGVLRALDTGGAGVVTTLLAFNLGVEAGQLAVVAAVFPVLVLLQRRSWYQPAMRTGSAMILAIAGFWFIQRLLVG
ncbi:MAG: HupE/UreJ family protein [Alphaproteobacteria bacterium]|nr:HupE/UreJ family protein [Alphaproteobacteria bacterium]MDP6813940.1 HupE/UreJ family protein [Alphaproteobacteria bacterium]